jgi:hypothetical protein
MLQDNKNFYLQVLGKNWKSKASALMLQEHHLIIKTESTNGFDYIL